jgi:hypothetical protein
MASFIILGILLCAHLARATCSDTQFFDPPNKFKVIKGDFVGGPPLHITNNTECLQEFSYTLKASDNAGKEVTNVTFQYNAEN